MGLDNFKTWKALIFFLGFIHYSFAMDLLENQVSPKRKHIELYLDDESSSDTKEPESKRHKSSNEHLLVISSFNDRYAMHKKSNCIHNIQNLWMYMENLMITSQSREEVKKILYSQVLDYFIPCPGTTNFPNKHNFPERFDAILVQCLRKKTCPIEIIFNFFEISKETRFDRFIKPERFKFVDNLILGDPEISIRERSIAFHNIKGHTTDLTGFQEWLPKALGDSPITTYGQLIFEHDNAKESIFDLYQVKRKLIELKKTHPTLFIPIQYLKLYNIFDEVAFLPHSSLSFQEISKNIHHLVSPGGGTLYGLWKSEDDLDTVTFYACDEQSGYALWSLPLEIQSELPKFSLGDKIIFFLLNKTKVLMVDRQSGDELTLINEETQQEHVQSPFSTPDALPIVHIGATQNNHLFLVHKKGIVQNTFQFYVTLFDFTKLTKTKPYLLSFPDEEADFRTIGNYFSFSSPSSSVISFIGTNGQERNIDGKLIRIWDDRPKWTLFSNYVLFCRYFKAQSCYQLVSHNLETNQEMWFINLKNEISKNPTISTSLDKIFVQDSETITSFYFSPENASQPLWKSPIISQITSHGIDISLALFPSLDGLYVYGVNEENHQLSRYNAKTGQQDCFEQLDYLQNISLLGIGPKEQIYYQGHR